MSDTKHDLFDFTSFPVLTTQRLVLREIIHSDAQAIMAIRGDYEVTKYNIGKAYRYLNQSIDLIIQMSIAYRNGREIRWGIMFKDTDKIIGMCGFNYWNKNDHRGSIGFDLARAYWRQGIMSEALSHVIAFGFERMGLNRIEADASVYNMASIKTLEKHGFTQEGIQREQYYEDERYHDLILFSLLRREWLANQ